MQVSSLPTERQRVLNTEKWTVHGHGGKTLAIVDEAHLNAGPTAQRILDLHEANGGVRLGVTATPIDLGHLYSKLIVAGTLSQLRRARVLVPAYHYGPDEPDMKGFKQNVKTGEYSENDVRKAIMNKAVWGRVWEHYQLYNPTRRPTILFAPGVKESQWFAEQFDGKGCRAAHIDGDGIWLDGEYTRTQDREHLLRAVREGDIKVICNRFVLREGLDLPEVSHLILATVMGSLGTYLQSAGRGLRACEGKDRLTIQDHGGHWWRHGSVNLDREWHLNYTETMLSGMRAEKLREKREAEPICCPQCQMIYRAGPACPNCGRESSRRSRMVIQQDGSLKEHAGDIFKPRRVMLKQNTQKLWQGQYWRAFHSKNKMTFRQAEALFFLDNHYYPPRTLKMMPIDPVDWFLKVRECPKEKLRS